MLILTTSGVHNTSQPHTPEFTQSTKGLHLLQNNLKSIQMKILFHSILIKAISKQYFVEPSGVQAFKNPNPLKDVDALAVVAVAVLV